MSSAHLSSRPEDLPSQPTLPTTPELLTLLLQQLSKLTPAHNPAPEEPFSTSASHDTPQLHNTLPISSKNIILTLHCLLPHVLLPALDLLDRGLVIRYIPEYAVDKDGGSEEEHGGGDGDRNGGEGRIPSNPICTNNSNWVYYIKSGNSKSYTYEIRTDVWHCTCANFAFYAFSSASTSASSHSVTTAQKLDGQSAKEGEEEEEDATGALATNWSWGGSHLIDDGSSANSTIPICKHLLAAVLSEQCPSLFRSHVKEKLCSVNELAELSVWW